MQSLDLKISGLYTFGSELSEAPPGALSKADNIVINRPSVAEPRRGFDRMPGAFSDVTYRANKLFFYQNQTLCHYSTATLAYNTGSVWSNYTGTFNPPSATVKVRACEANQNFYFTTSAGVFKLDSYSATPLLSGAYKGLDLTASLSATAGWLTVSYRVAYRVVWGYYDANNNLILGAPSQRETIKNTAGALQSVSIRATAPVGVTTSWIYQLYRSEMVDNTTATTEPTDEMRLVYQGSPNSTDISNGYVTIADITDDTLRLGATIYTAASQEGLANGNERPPLAKDVAVYKNVMFYGNTISKQRYYLTMLSVGGTNGIAVNDTVTIGGVAYTGKAAEAPASAQFAVATTGSASQNIRDTAVSLCRVINQYSSSTVYAYYLSSSADLPGKILLEERSIGGGAFYAVSTRATCWSPSLPTSGTTQASVADTFKNAIYFSKVSQPEAVPIANYLFAGSAQKNILRILPLRDSLFILKEDGIYRLTGENPASFRLDLLDSTAILLAPDSAVVLNNQIYALTSQGVVAITDTGVSVLSRPIESTLLSLQGADLAVLKNASFGVSYESERKYVLFVLSATGDTKPTQAFVYNTFTNSWTRWPLTKTCGGVNPADDKLYLGDGSSPYVNIERKAFKYSDYADYGMSITISAVSGKVLTVTNSDQIAVGDVIYQTASIFSTVASVDTVAGTVTTTVTAAFTAAAADVLKAISTAISWIPFTFGNPGMDKHIREVLVLFKSDFTGTGTLRFSSDKSKADETETITGTALGLWGLFPWGSVPWGGANVRKPYRKFVPRNKQRCTQLTVGFEHSTGFAAYQLNGISEPGEMQSERVSR